MPKLFQIDWAHLLVPTVALGEIILRGSLVYLLLFALRRVTLKREAGSTALPELLMVVLVADAAQHAMATVHRSVTEGVVLVATIVGWNYALDGLAHTFPRLRQVMHPPRPAPAGWSPAPLSPSRGARTRVCPPASRCPLAYAPPWNALGSPRATETSPRPASAAEGRRLRRGHTMGQRARARNCCTRVRACRILLRQGRRHTGNSRARWGDADAGRPCLSPPTCRVRRDGSGGVPRQGSRRRRGCDARGAVRQRTRHRLPGRHGTACVCQALQADTL